MLAMHFVLHVFRILLGTREPVHRSRYLIAGVSLILIKVAVEALAIWSMTGRWHGPEYFIPPSFELRNALTQELPGWVGGVWFVWTLPFLWIAASMSIRRAVDACVSPWLGLIVVVPFVNFFVIALLAVLPSRPNREPESSTQPPITKSRSTASAAALSACAAVLIGGLVLAISVYVLGSYGLVLFFGSPLMMGMTAGYLFNRSRPRGHFDSALLGLATVIFGSAVLLLFALEGIVCIAMALPIAVPQAAIGAWLGRQIGMATQASGRGMMASVLVLLALLPVESRLNGPREYVVRSSIDIAASPQEVWEKVIAFPEIDEPLPWLFRLGIAAPERARIEGVGLGAIRYCEFSTGAFVEPITAWEPGKRLAFDVQAQPDPLIELSPYGHIHPPHLDGFMKSKRGEFRLVPLADGGTRLEGLTWYEIDMYPQCYWRSWCDTIVHEIHMRVLRHIASTTLDTTHAN